MRSPKYLPKIDGMMTYPQTGAAGGQRPVEWLQHRLEAGNTYG